MDQKWISHNEDETANIAQQIAALLSYPAILCLYGDLGAGKTAFCRALIRNLINDPDANIPSPTYTLVQTYDADAIWHFDLYRLEFPQDVYDAGWEEALTSKLCLIEWPERLGDLKPDNAIDIQITAQDDGSRLIVIRS